jgi:hypothetical protein
MVGGLNWAGDPCGLENTGGDGGKCTEIADMPTDPDNQLAISFHTYNWTACITTSCWNTVATAAKGKYPIITGELGEEDCTDNYVNSYMDWADQNDVSYVMSFWDVNGASSCQAPDAVATGDMISDYQGDVSSVSPIGADYKSHLAQEAPTE